MKLFVLLFLISDLSQAASSHWTGKLSLEGGSYRFQPCYEREVYELSGSEEIIGEIEKAFLSIDGALDPGGTLTASKIYRLLRLKRKQCDYYKADSLNIDPSWMKAPPGARDAVTCDDKVCKCHKGQRPRINEKTESGLQFRIENTLKRLRTGWRRYDAGSKSAQSAACSIMLDQKLLELYYPPVRDKVGRAYEKYMDTIVKIQSQCVHPEIMGWTQSEKAKEWVECQERNRPQLREAEKGKRSLRVNYSDLKKALGNLNRPKE